MEKRILVQCTKCKKEVCFDCYCQEKRICTDCLSIDIIREYNEKYSEKSVDDSTSYIPSGG